MNNNFNINALNITRPQRASVPNVAGARSTPVRIDDKRNRKRRVLVWSDAVCATTGFGVVSKYILKALYDTGRYEIDQLAINYFGDFLDTKEYPYQLQAARLNNPKDPYGNQQFLDALTKKPYDLVFVINDTFVVEEVAKHIDEIRAVKRSSNHPMFKLIYYFPVDCRYMSRAASFSKTADYNIAYTDFSKESALKVEGIKVHDVIYHGTDTKTFRSLPAEQCRIFRKKFFNVDDDNRFILLNINRNNTRKDMARSILAFKEFRKQVPNSMMYMHTKLVDSPGWGHQIDLGVCLEHLGLNMQNDVIFPRELNAANGFPVEAINQIYNAADAYITTTLGEGWGLSCGPNTYINTSEGVKFLKDIEVGDKVLTSNGMYEEVLDTTNREESVVYELKPKYSPSVITSELHPYLASKDRGRTLQWLNVKELDVGDYVAIVKPKDEEELLQEIDLTQFIDCEHNEKYVWLKMGYSPNRAGLSISKVQQEFNISKRVAEDALNKFRGKVIRSRCLPGSQAHQVYLQLNAKYIPQNIEPIKMSRHIKVDDSFLEFIGWYLAEGSSENGVRIELSLHKNERHIAEKFQSWCLNVLGIESTVEDFDNKSRLRISNSVLASFLQQECGKGAFNKRIPSWLIENPTCLGFLLRGLLEGDGCFANGQVVLCTVSPSLAYQVRDLCASVGILTAIRQDKARLGNYDPYYVTIKHRSRLSAYIDTKIDPEVKPIDCIELPNYFLVPIESITRSEDNLDLLYDICVENSHSFVANGIIAHNTVTEAMATGLPVIAPHNTSLPEILGTDGERGYMYPCKEEVYVDNCYIPDTEVLTDGGWKFFEDLKYSDRLCTLNTETEVIEYHYPDKIIAGQYQGKVYSLSSQSAKIDIAVTENHNILALKHQDYKKKNRNWQFFKPRQIEGCKTFHFKKDGLWQGTTPEVFCLSSQKQIPIKLWMEFMGYYLSEGSCTYAEKSHYIVQLRQNAGPLLDRMCSLFQEMGFNPHIGSDKNRVIVYSKELYGFLKPLGKKHEKYIPREMLLYNKDLLTILFESMMLGDGHNLYYQDYRDRSTVSTKGGSSYATSSISLRDDVMELLLKIGYSGSYRLQSPKGTPWHIEERSGISNYDLWVIGVRYRDNTPCTGSGYKKVNNQWVRRETWEESWIPYEGKVYCATVKNHTMYIRRNGCPMWSGNSGFRPCGRMEDIVETMMVCYNDWKDVSDPYKLKIQQARAFTEQYSWDNVCKKWVDLFEHAFVTENQHDSVEIL